MLHLTSSLESTLAWEKTIARLNTWRNPTKNIPTGSFIFTWIRPWTAYGPTRVFRTCRGASAFPYVTRSLHERGRGPSSCRSTRQTVSSGVQLLDTAVGALNASVEFRLLGMSNSDIEAKQTAEALELD